MHADRVVGDVMAQAREGKCCATVSTVHIWINRHTPTRQPPMLLKEIPRPPSDLRSAALAEHSVQLYTHKEINMAKIMIQMSTGELFTISNAFYGAEGPMSDRRAAEVQMSFILSKLVAVGTDQGKTINVAQIVSEWVVD